ncbi:MAG: alanine/glycine:cation symporter family protein [Fusobacteriaceae bacterium]
MVSSVSNLNKILWGNFTLAFFMGTGIFFSFKLGFIQIRKFREGIKRIFESFSIFGKAPNLQGTISPFQALIAVAASQTGSGNISGVATAIAAGGPGALFWMWVSSFFSMSIVYSEAVLAQLFRKEIDGKIVGGAAYYIRDGLGKNRFSKILATLFSLACVFSLGLVGNAVQSHSLSRGLSNLFNISPIFIGGTLSFMAGVIFFGGIKRIVAVLQKLVPIMTGIYVLACLIIIAFNAELFLQAVGSIFEAVFTPKAFLGGAIGTGVQRAMRYGVTRGLFSNGAGLGTTSHAHAIAESVHPAQQGILATLAVFIDTFIVTCTGFIILMSGKYGEGLTGISLTQSAFYDSVGEAGSIFVTFCLFLFAFTTILSWYLFGEINLKFHFKDKGIKRYRFFVLIAIFLGPLVKPTFIWELSDFFMALMLIPNLTALILLSGTVKKYSEEYEELRLSEIYPEIEDLEEEY